MIKIILLVLIISLSSCGKVRKEVSQVCTTSFIDNTIQAQIDSLYERMSIHERAAQLHGVRPKHLVENGKLSIEKCRKIIPYGVGHVSQFACMQDLSPDELRDFVKELQNYLIHETASGIPAIFHEEAITGFATKGATVFPQQIGVACTWNPELVERKSEYTREVMRSCGATMALSPMVDVIRTQHFNRVEESYGEDAYLASRIALSFIKGLQTEDMRRGVATCTKHFLGYGGGINSDEKELMEEIMMPHEVGIKMGNSKAVMTGYHSYKGETAITNSYFIQNLLRDYLRFDGIVVSDYFAIAAKKLAKDSTHFFSRAVKAMDVGADLELCDGECYPLLPQLLKEGKVSEKRFEQAVKLNLAMKVRLGLLDQKPELYEKGHLDLDKPEYRKTAYELATQSVVLLENNGILPLKPASRIALVGPNANTFWCMLGDYTYQSLHAFFQSGQVDADNPKIYSLKEGLEAKACRNFEICYERGCDWSTDEEAQVDKKTNGDSRIQHLKMMMLGTDDSTDWEKAISLGKENDVVIAAVGENPTLCGEGRSRVGIKLPGKQEQFVEELIATGTPVVVVIFGGRAQVLSEYIRHNAAAILQAWYPGEEGGNAVADILLGNVNPSGKLCVSYPATQAKAPICYNYGEQDSKKVAYPFGYGLSYTNFEYSAIDCTEKVEIGKEEVRLSFKLKNSGEYAGTEIVQLYLSPQDKEIPVKPIQLKGFERVSLQPGEEKEVVFRLMPELLSFYKGGQWQLLPGNYELKIGSSSEDIRLLFSLKLTGNVKIMHEREVFFSHSEIN